MKEKNSRTRLPINFALGLLLCTVVAAYFYQAKQTSQDAVPLDAELGAMGKTHEEVELQPQDKTVVEGPSELTGQLVKPKNTKMFLSI